MLSNKKFSMAFVLLALILISCNKREEPRDSQVNKPDLNDSNYVKQQAKNILGDDLKFAYSGLFDADSLMEISAGTEIENKDTWGIRFYLLKQKESSFVNEFETPLLKGSFSGCLVRKIKFPDFNSELLYYSSQDYFLGSAGGEIFSYIIDYTNKQVYYAHLIAEAEKPVSLFLSDNLSKGETSIKNAEIKNFFISNFKRDYPSVQILSKDIDLKY